MNDLPKHRIRREVATAVAGLDRRIRDRDEAANAEALLAWWRRRSGGELGAYVALADECDPAAVVAAAWERGERVWLPRVAGERALTWHPVSGPDELGPGAFGLSEPDLLKVPGRDLPAGCTLLVPGVAFTREGSRLGRGAGFFDVALAGVDARTIGYAYPCQLLDVLPEEPHDRRVDAVLAGGRWYGGARG